jgi:dolichol-phosphate mannosyltransferase
LTRQRAIIVVPTYNERGNVRMLVRRIRDAVGDVPILFIEDSSPDGTADEIRAVQEADPEVQLLERTARRSFAAACREGYRTIIDRGVADCLIQLDADLSHPPEALPRMMELLGRCPVVVGSRYVSGGATGNWGLSRRMLSRFGNLYARLLTAVPVHDLTAGFIGIQIDTLKKLPLTDMKSEGYAFLMEMKYSLHRRGIAIREFPITFVERERGRSKFSGRTVLEGLAYPLKVLARRALRRA